MDDLTFWLDDIGNVSSPQQWENGSLGTQLKIHAMGNGIV